ncbi:acyltransferase family protein [Schlesneria sp. T3-172]|uniref:acyltransferase family protein n=1 Tax=Schlesneria sphaerica TaxID=3373610 RepID=UPI0037C8489F
MKAPTQLRYHLIEPLRGLAAVWVFVFHFSFSEAFQHAFPFLHSLLKAGDRAVPMFFVISGYCLATAFGRAQKHGQSFGNFLYQRARRIYPTFWLSIAVIIAAHFGTELLKALVTGEWGAVNTSRFRHYNWFDWVKIASLTQIFDQRFGLFFGRFGSVNGAYWTLGIEFQFYLIVALGLLRPRWSLWLAAALTAVSLATFYHPVWKFHVMNTGSCIPFWSWFALGVAVHALLKNGLTPASLFRHREQWISGALVAGLGIAFLAVTAAGYEVERLVFAVGFAVALWAGKSLDLTEPAPRAAGGSLANYAYQGLCVLGAMSYSVYLLHNQASESWRSVLRLGGVQGSIIADLLCVGLTVLCCYPFYLYCEAPFLRSRRRPAIAEVPAEILSLPTGDEATAATRKAA